MHNQKDVPGVPSEPPNPAYPSPQPYGQPYGPFQGIPYGAPQGVPRGPPGRTSYGQPQRIPHYLPYSTSFNPGMRSNQLQIMEWMPKPTVSGCPPGLEYLTQIDQILVKQLVEIFEVMTRLETENRYVCANTLSQQIYSCVEESDFYMRLHCGSQRSFVMHIKDNNNMEVIRIHRPYTYRCMYNCFSFFGCCLNEMTIEAPPGQVVGYVKQTFNGCQATFDVLDANGTKVLNIRGPNYWHCQYFGQDVNFKVLSLDGVTQVGNITKQFSGFMQEYFTDADNFGVTFPMDLDVRIKAVLLGAVFLIDFVFFENNAPGLYQR